MLVSVQGEHPIFGRRVTIASVIVCLILGFIAIRLWYLQGIQGAYFRDLSENNRIRTVRTIAPRGNIYDRNGKELVKNRPAFQVALMLEDVEDVDRTIVEIAELTGRDVEELEERLKSKKTNRPFEPQVLIFDASREELARIKVNTYRLPGVIVNVVPLREYPHSALAAQLFGYSREISREQLKKEKFKEYRSGDMVGQSGLEKELEGLLRGAHGYTQVEVDARGNRRRELGIVDSLPGNDVYLTLDVELQQVAEEAFKDKQGALVAIDPRNGEVLALVSSPAFDANIFLER